MLHILCCKSFAPEFNIFEQNTINMLSLYVRRQRLTQCPSVITLRVILCESKINTKLKHL